MSFPVLCILQVPRWNRNEVSWFGSRYPSGSEVMVLPQGGEGAHPAKEDELMNEKSNAVSNDRLKDETIARTSLGDNANSVVEVDSDGVAKVLEQLENSGEQSSVRRDEDSSDESPSDDLAAAEEHDTTKTNRALKEAFYPDERETPLSVPPGGPPD